MFLKISDFLMMTFLNHFDVKEKTSRWHLKNYTSVYYF